MSGVEQSILEKARRLKKLERDFREHTYESKKPQSGAELEEFFNKAVTISEEAFRLRNEIQLEYHDTAVLQIIDPEVKALLNKIKEDDIFYSIDFYKRFIDFLNKDIESPLDRYSASLEDYMLDLRFDELFSEFHSWFDIVGYYSAKAKIGPIISTSEIKNDRIRAYFDEIKETCAFGQYRSSVALCRALLEMALFDKLNRKGVIEIAKEDNLSKFITQSKRFRILSSTMADLAHEVRESANNILHLKELEAGSDLTEKRTFRIIFQTVRVLEYLYG
ncbi:MAG: DUF4145 domain-containing protein [Deltaproteobacteria bacterium]|nr:DUF4145 domain-containing protein [Deltaproteobacteria bacterium]